MIEPTYIYEKGKGWIPTDDDLFQMKDKLVLLEYRPPKLGERYTYFPNYDDFYVQDRKTLKLEVFKREYRVYRLADFGELDPDDFQYDKECDYLDAEGNDTGKRIWVVFTEVSSV